MAEVNESNPADRSEERADVIKTLMGRGTPEGIATIFADKLMVYKEASANIAANGAIVSHPRTGEPISNPYLKVREDAAAALLKFRTVDSSGLW